MSKAFGVRDQNVIVGRGELFVARVLADGSYDGEDYVGDSPSVSLSIQDDVERIQSSDPVVPVTLATVVRSSTRTFAWSTQDANDRILSDFVGGLPPVDVAAKADAAVTDEEITITSLERWYQLGVSAARPEGARRIKDVVIRAKKAGAVADAYDAASSGDMGNFFVDADWGRIYIPDNQTDAAGASADKIAPGSKIYVTYKDASPARTVTRTGGAAKQAYGALRFLGESPSGKARNIYARSCIIAASGEATIKQDQGRATLNFSCEVQKPSGGWPELTLDGETLPADSVALLAALG